MIRRLRSERGTVLATTMILMGLMTMGALATYSYVDTQTTESGRERVRETSFNVGEGLLGSQVFILSRAWPGSASSANGATGPYPATCANGSSHERCPDGASLVSAFGGVDVAKGVTWQTRVLDNCLDFSCGTPPPAGADRCSDARLDAPYSYNDATMLAAPVTYDSNGDCRMWVRAQAAIDGRRRTFVGLVRVEQITEQFPQKVITAGHVGSANQGNKVLVDTQGDAGQPSGIAVRCPQTQAGCVDTDKDVQISPRNIEYSYPSPTAMAVEALERLRERAKSLGTYYPTVSGCPSTLSGSLVFVESGTISCTGNTAINSPTNPGMLVVATGTAYIGNEFYGLLHMANLQNSSGWVVTVGGNGLVQGAISVDGPGGVKVGADKYNVVYAEGVFRKAVSYGSAGIIQNTWREIVPAA
ncbi:MAG TPA: hypothetical protein VNB64_01680 [Solirubrobacteraceae bacterium]|nr:hypothetical protein [Solirubrobacteraceae bacterium]